MLMCAVDRGVDADAQTIGHGGIEAVARAAGVDPKTVTAGLDALDSRADPLPSGRVCRSGAGRPRCEETDPGLMPALGQVRWGGVRG